jgi:hypothetical protein
MAIELGTAFTCTPVGLNPEPSLTSQDPRPLSRHPWGECEGFYVSQSIVPILGFVTIPVQFPASYNKTRCLLFFASSLNFLFS